MHFIIHLHNFPFLLHLTCSPPFCSSSYLLLLTLYYYKIPKAHKIENVMAYGMAWHGWGKEEGEINCPVLWLITEMPIIDPHQ